MDRRPFPIERPSVRRTRTDPGMVFPVDRCRDDLHPAVAFGWRVSRAGLFLQAGTFAAAILTILARLVSGRSFALPPLGTAVLLGMAAIGLTRLQPWLPSAISMMDHSVYPEFRAQLPRPEALETNAAAKRFPAASRSVAPAEHVVMWPNGSPLPSCCALSPIR